MAVISFVWYMIVLVCVLAAAVIGMDFSPSFTAMFLVTFLALTVLVEFCNYFKGKKLGRVFRSIEFLFSIVGSILVMVSVYIYAFGDDLLRIWVWLALTASVIGHFAIWFLLYRKQGREMGVDWGLENWTMLAAGIFTLACAVSSTALWPYGSGVLLILTARWLRDVRADGLLSRGLTVLGALLCAVFSVAPMVF